MSEKPVVVGYNDRPHSRLALTWAVREASRRGAPLVVLYAANYPGMATAGSGPGLRQWEPDALEAAEEVTLHGVGAALTQQPDLRVSGLTPVTSPSQALIDASADASLLVLGTRRLGSALGAILGSVAFTVAGRARCPVIVVKAASSADEGLRPKGRVVVGTDGSASAAGAVEFAAESATATSAALEIVAATGQEPGPGVGVEQARASMTHVVDSSVAVVRSAWPSLSVAGRVEDGSAEQALIAASAQADLVVVGSRGRGAFEGLLLGSVSHAVIHGSDCSVGVVGGADMATGPG
jgi:nucleotide-binding universal stress UspA family protein